MHEPVGDNSEVNESVAVGAKRWRNHLPCVEGPKGFEKTFRLAGDGYPCHTRLDSAQAAARDLRQVSSVGHLVCRSESCGSSLPSEAALPSCDGYRGGVWM